MKKWECIMDYQGDNFMVGEIRTLEEWKRAFYDTLSEGLPMQEELKQRLKNLNEENLIDFAKDIISIELIKLDEEQLKKDFFKTIENHEKEPYKKHTQEQVWEFFKDWVGEEHWDNLIVTHCENQGDMGYWFQDWNDFIFAFVCNLYGDR